ncbi:aldehyde dehydrogenase family protein [Candidatus Planktophila versatilis]|uniref:aldehyde dehydrogenase family protein n=1 Tax=Candidatus Planktophila versatilis TaxID=1884905 RepID=UPI000BACA8D8|nr:aldehyde dehydrogenase family protein [Candidatus Planktophila versatilis]ASY26707.1 aldehyde dehydrogenase (NAD+) [Candidatus Planktophila versatilis]
MTTKKQPRVDVKKTYKLFINGAFARSESGRVFEVTAKNGDFIANPALASRKDLRDAVTAARAAQSGWAKATAYNRGQILYRIAEMLEGRAEQFESEIALTSQITAAKAKAQVTDAIDRWVWYAGWSDKLQAVSGATNPVSGPFFNFSISEPQGVIAIASDVSFIDFIDAIAAAVVSGNTTLVLVPGSLAVPAMTFAEVLATSDLPAGVINILTGSLDELAPWAASHMDIDGFDISGINKKKHGELKVAGAENLKRIHAFSTGQSPSRILAFMESKTVWHSVGV